MTTTKPQDAEIHSTKAVTKSNVLETNAEYLTSDPMTVQWSQKWTTRSEKYYSVVFENITQGGERGRLFISEKALDEFKHNPIKDGNYVFKVDEEYQYGQANSAGNDRFLVFHNKNNTIYQHRFVRSMWLNLGHKIGEIAGDAAPGAVKNVVPAVEKQIQNMFGDPLKNF
ncbi:hypothetical protein MMC17_003039 [Xylographa soralifera]|nr:hypothetical protein [Xylographa soralifera]